MVLPALAAIAASGALSSWLSSRQQRKAIESQKFKKVDTLSRDQRKLLERMGEINPEDFDIQNQGLYGQGSDYLSNLLSGNPEAYRDFEAPYMTQFNEEIIPNVAERFSQVGGQRSSAFNQALAREGSNLSQRLAQLRSGLQMQALPQALQYAQQPFQNAYQRSALSLGTPAFGYQSTGGMGGGGFAPALGQGVASGIGAYGLYSMMNQMGS